MAKTRRFTKASGSINLNTFFGSNPVSGGRWDRIFMERIARLATPH